MIPDTTGGAMRQKKEEFSFLDCLFFLLPLFDKFFFLEREGKKGRDGPVFFLFFFSLRFFVFWIGGEVQKER